MRYFSCYAQNVGIGTTSPQGEFHVSNPFEFAGVIFMGTGLNDLTVDFTNYMDEGNTDYSVDITNAGPVPNIYRWSDDGGQSWSANLEMSGPYEISNGVVINFLDDFGHTYADRWDFTIGEGYLDGLVVKDGKVGIGTTMPQVSLDVIGKTRISQLDTASSASSQVMVEPDGTLAMIASSVQTYTVGDFAFGGVVFWVSPNGEHGKVVSINEVEDIPWSNITNTAIGSSALSFNNGIGNTNAIIMQSGYQRSAALHCANYACHGYDDWYLPTELEFDLIYDSLSLINVVSLENGGQYLNAINEDGYWMSLEVNANSAEVYLNRPPNGMYFLSKSSLRYVRPVRAF